MAVFFSISRSQIVHDLFGRVINAVKSYIARKPFKSMGAALGLSEIALGNRPGKLFDNPIGSRKKFSVVFSEHILTVHKLLYHSVGIQSDGKKFAAYFLTYH